jgi:two-component system, cell cycle response regulator DivK
MVLKDKRILLFEDDITNQAVMTMLLRQHGGLVLFERWGCQSPEFLKRYLPVDVILLDLMFPRQVTGYQVFDVLRSMPEFNATPVIAVTAADPDVEMPKVRALGFAGYISKPVHFNDFAKQIAQVLAGEQIWAPVL